MDNWSWTFRRQLEDASYPSAPKIQLWKSNTGCGHDAYTDIQGPYETTRALGVLVSAAGPQQQISTKVVPTLSKPEDQLDLTLDSSENVDGPFREHNGAENTIQHIKSKEYDSDSTLSDISDSAFMEFDIEALEIEDKPPSKKRKRPTGKITRSRKSLRKDVSEASYAEHVRGHQEIYTDRSGNPVSIFTTGHPSQQKKPASFATLNDVSHIGELMNNIYEWWRVSQFKLNRVTEGSPNRLARRCVIPPGPSLLRVCRKFREEATAKYYSDEISKCEGIYFENTKALYNFLTNSSKEEVQGLTAAWVNYEANVVEFNDRAMPYDHAARAQFKWLDGSDIYNRFYQIDLGPRYAFDAFELLRLKCPNLDTLVINRSLFGATLNLSYPGVWTLRGLRRLKRFRFEGAPGRYEYLNRIIRREVMRKKNRPQGEENTWEALRLRSRDSERQRGMTGQPMFREGVPTRVQWMPT